MSDDREPTTNAQLGQKIRVAVLFGGQSDEHDVSLRSAQTVIDALNPQQYEPVLIGITRDGQWLAGGDPMAQLTAHSPLFALPGQTESTESVPPPTGTAPTAALLTGADGGIDVVFPVLHGPRGEDGTVQGLLELAGIPYVGSGVLGSAVGMDKAVTRTILAQAGLPMARWQLVYRKEWEADPDGVAGAITRDFRFPCFVKPANMGSSVGVSKVHDASELAEAISTAAHFDRRIIVEEGIDAREIEVSVLGNDEPIASVAGEIIPANEFYDYEAKYIDDRSELKIPASIDHDTMSFIQSLAIDAFKALDLAGLARVDFFLERNTDHVYINEVNTLPGFTSISMYPLLWEASGIPLPELVDRLIGLALERHGDTRR